MNFECPPWIQIESALEVLKNYKHCTVSSTVYVQKLMAEDTSSFLFGEVFITREASGNMSSHTTLTLQILKENEPLRLPPMKSKTRKGLKYLISASEFPEHRCFESDNW